MAVLLIAAIFAVCSFVLLLLANLGTTFDSTFLPELYLVKFSQSINDRSIRYGVYNSCLYYGGKLNSCTSKTPAYLLSSTQFAELCGADLNDLPSVAVFKDLVAEYNLTIFRGIVLILPAVIFAFIVFIISFSVRKNRSSNTVPFIGAFAGLFGFFSGIGGLIIVIVTFWKTLEELESRVEGLSHQWGISIYLVGIGSGCVFVSVVCFLISLFTYNTEKRESVHWEDDDDMKTASYNNINSVPTPAHVDQTNYNYPAQPTYPPSSYPSQQQGYQQGYQKSGSYYI
ncbi:hypothetical protein BDB01DRAFT_18801 [Pilobolus umbonatus]|nr:hypothetical protein BDB01DRAFT_18801 [Pilobolus umbonatus]